MPIQSILDISNNYSLKYAIRWDDSEKYKEENNDTKNE